MAVCIEPLIVVAIQSRSISAKAAISTLRSYFCTKLWPASEGRNGSILTVARRSREPDRKAR